MAHIVLCNLQALWLIGACIAPMRCLDGKAITATFADVAPTHMRLCWNGGFDGGKGLTFWAGCSFGLCFLCQCHSDGIANTAYKAHTKVARLADVLTPDNSAIAAFAKGFCFAVTLRTLGIARCRRFKFRPAFIAAHFLSGVDFFECFELVTASRAFAIAQAGRTITTGAIGIATLGTNWTLQNTPLHFGSG